MDFNLSKAEKIKTLYKFLYKLGSPKGRVLVAIKNEIKALLREDNED